MPKWRITYGDEDITEKVDEAIQRSNRLSRIALGDDSHTSRWVGGDTMEVTPDPEDDEN